MLDLFQTTEWTRLDQPFHFLSFIYTMQFIMQSILLFILCSSTAFAQLLAFAWDNDIAFATDGDYTNGLRFTWLSEEHSILSCSDCTASRWKNTLSLLPGLGQPNSLYSTSLNLEQLMITPVDLTASTPQYEDTPYAGLLRLELGVFARETNSLTGYALSLGATGKKSLAAQSQKLVHDWTNSTEPQGWKHQLPAKPVLGVTAVRARQLVDQQGDLLQIHMGYAAATRLDSWMVDAQTGVFGSFGQNLPSNLLPAYSVMGSAASLPGLDNLKQPGWALYGGLMSRYVFWSYIQEESRKAGYKLKGKPDVHAIFVGTAVQGYGWLLSVSIQKSSAIIERSDKSMSYGSISVTRQL